MKEFFLKLFLAKRLNDKKTYIISAVTGLAGLGQILFGLVGMTAGLVPDIGFEPMSLDEGLAQIKGGCTMLAAAFGGASLRHAIDKTAVKE